MRPRPAARFRRLALAASALWLHGLIAAQDPTAAQAPTAASQPPDLVVVETDVFEIRLSADGGVPVAWTVADPAAGTSEVLIDTELVAAGAHRPLAFVARTGGEGVPAADLRRYSVERESDGATERVVFTSPVEQGLQVAKVYEFERRSHLFTLRADITNHSDAAQEIAPAITLGPGLGYGPERSPVPPDEGRSAAVLPFFKTAGGVFGVGLPYEEPWTLRYPAAGEQLEWGGLHSQYFTVVVLPPPERGGGPPLDHAWIELPVAGAAREHYPAIALCHAPSTLAPGATRSTTYTVFAGPKDRALLQETGLGLEAIPFHHLWDWLASICLALQYALARLESVLNSWGVAIIAFALLFRLLTLPLSLYGIKHQMLMKAKMATLKPLVAQIKAEHKNADRRNEAILALYKEHGVNPFAQFKGCLPLVVQLPVLIALFQLLLNSYDLRGVRFLWIDDLTLPDRLFPLGFSIPWLGSYFNLLPIIMLLAQVATARAMQRSSPSSGGALYALPIAMTLLFYPFPSGCMLFWTTGTIWQLFEQRFALARAARLTS